MIAIIDNYDSFTWNLAHYVGYFCPDYKVMRNDDFELPELEEFEKILLSPGPGMPSRVPVLAKIIAEFGERKPILGICLGMQAIAEYYGGGLINLEKVMHGVQTACEFDDVPLFRGVERPFKTGHYHSWVVNPGNIPSGLRVTATGPGGLVMALQHEKHPVQGVQFHPESVLTPQGLKLMENWCKL